MSEHMCAYGVSLKTMTSFINDSCGNYEVIVLPSEKKNGTTWFVMLSKEEATKGFMLYYMWIRLYFLFGKDSAEHNLFDIHNRMRQINLYMETFYKWCEKNNVNHNNSKAFPNPRIVKDDPVLTARDILRRAIVG